VFGDDFVFDAGGPGGGSGFAQADQRPGGVQVLLGGAALDVGVGALDREERVPSSIATSPSTTRSQIPARIRA